MKLLSIALLTLLVLSITIRAEPKVPIPLAANPVPVSPKEPCSGGEPSPGPSCRCYVSLKTGVQYCFPRPGVITCDFDIDCGSPQRSVLFAYVPVLGLVKPSWHTFVF